jgi:hypothetical protein
MFFFEYSLRNQNVKNNKNKKYIFIAAQRIFNSTYNSATMYKYVNEFFSIFLLDFSVFISADGQRLSMSLLENSGEG